MNKWWLAKEEQLNETCAETPRMNITDKADTYKVEEIYEDKRHPHKKDASYTRMRH